MATEFCDSFQIYFPGGGTSTATNQALSQASLQTRWNAVGQGGACYVATNVTTRGSNALLIGFGGAITKTFSHQSTYIVGCRVKMNSLAGVGGGPFLTLLNGGTPIVTLVTNANGSLYAYAGGLGTNTVLTTPIVLSASVEAYLEFQASISGSTNISVIGDAWVNSQHVGNGTHTSGLNNASFPSRDTTMNQLAIESGAVTNGQVIVSDFYILNGTGSWNTSRLSANTSYPFVVVEKILPRLDGSTLQWVPGTGTVHYTQINTLPAPNGTTLLTSTVTGNIDTYHWEPVPTFAKSIKSAQLGFHSDSTDEGLCTIKGGIGTAVQEQLTAEFGLCNSYIYHYQPFDTDPATSLPWTKPNFDAKQFGLELIHKS